MKNKNENELIQYILINEDLQMSPGKVAAQVGHVCTICAYNCLDDNSETDENKFMYWYAGEQKKIILRAHEKEMCKLIEHGFWYYILDKGYTEISADSLTALSLGILTRREALPFVKRLQLMK